MKVKMAPNYGTWKMLRSASPLPLTVEGRSVSIGVYSPTFSKLKLVIMV